MRVFSQSRPVGVFHRNAPSAPVVLDRVLESSAGHTFEQRIAGNAPHHFSIPCLTASVRSSRYLLFVEPVGDGRAVARRPKSIEPLTVNWRRRRNYPPVIVGLGTWKFRITEDFDG